MLTLEKALYHKREHQKKHELYREGPEEGGLEIADNPNHPASWSEEGRASN